MASNAPLPGPGNNSFALDLATHITALLETSRTLAASVYNAVPGHTIIYKYIKASYQDDPVRTFLELLLVVFIVTYMSKKRKPLERVLRLTEKEVDVLVDEWEPEALVPELSEWDREKLERVPVLTSANSLKPTLKDRKAPVMNFSSFNFLGIMNHDKIKNKALAALRNYGVGTCGPPGFYGTVDVHMQLEADLATFLNCQEAIIYSQGFSTIGSVVPAFAKKGDLIIADAGCSFSIQKGLQISRSTIKWFKHNDMADLERILLEQKKKDEKDGEIVTRRFIVVEGVYENYGDICSLPKIVELKHNYKYRIILEESFAFGVLGKTGRGTCEHYDLPTSEVDIISSTLCNSFAASGGFCAGNTEIVDHQRLSGLAYCFSASMPAILAITAMEGLTMLADSSRDLLHRLRENERTVLSGLRELKGGETSGHDGSAIMHLRLGAVERERLGILAIEEGEKKIKRVARDIRESFGGDSKCYGKWWIEEEKVLQEVVDEALKDNILLTLSHYVVGQEMFLPRPSIRVSVSAGFTKRECETLVKVLRSCWTKVLSRKR